MNNQTNSEQYLQVATQTNDETGRINKSSLQIAIAKAESTSFTNNVSRQNILDKVKKA